MLYLQDVLLYLQVIEQCGNNSQFYMPYATTVDDTTMSDRRPTRAILSVWLQTRTRLFFVQDYRKFHVIMRRTNNLLLFSFIKVKGNLWSWLMNLLISMQLWPIKTFLIAHHRGVNTIHDTSSQVSKLLSVNSSAYTACASA